MKKIADWKEMKICRHQEHSPPSMVVLDPGVYEHACPGCGHKQIVVVPPRPTLCGKLKRALFTATIAPCVLPRGHAHECVPEVRSSRVSYSS